MINMSERGGLWSVVCGWVVGLCGGYSLYVSCLSPNKYNIL